MFYYICAILLFNNILSSAAFIFDDDFSIISRNEWNAMKPVAPPKEVDEFPVPFVVIHHSATPRCFGRKRCESSVKAFQNYHINHNKWDDIGYNFVVGEDGNAYEGRGWGVTGAHAISYNQRSMGICIIGNFESDCPSPKALEKVQKLIAYGVQLGEISKDYKLIGHGQVSTTDCPGHSLLDLIKKWPHWANIRK